MTGLTREALRLECIKLAAMLESRSGVDNVRLCADKIFEWVLEPHGPGAPVLSITKGKPK